jgi:hypothetical protein
MLGEAKAIYLATRKKHDQLFNTYFMRPWAAAAVSGLARTAVTPNQLTLLNVALFAVAAILFVALPDARGGWIAALVLELSYLFDCCDGMLARHTGRASKQGHLFDFFTDELKAMLLVAALSIRLWRSGGYSPWGQSWPPGSDAFLLAGIGGGVAVAAAISLTNFVRRPEISGRETTVDAYYETVASAAELSGLRRLVAYAMTFLRFLNHYPSHVWLFALLGRLDVFLWIYVAINALYLARGWLSLALRFGRPAGP